MSLTDMGLVVDLLGGIPITVERRGGAYDDETGLWAIGAPTTIEIVAAVDVDPPGTAIALLPEGERDNDAIMIFAKELLVGPQKGAASMADVVTVGDRQWRVMAVRDMTLQGGHCEAVCTRLWTEDE